MSGAEQLLTVTGDQLLTVTGDASPTGELVFVTQTSDDGDN
jgi:hypothetical protein